MNRKVLIPLCVFIISRFIFINPLPVFFDSPEYLARFSNPNYFQAMSSGHTPFHAGYIMLFWPIFHIAKLLEINPPFTIIFAQIIISAIAIYCFYRFTAIISNYKIATIASIILSLTPIYWIINVSVMAELTYINFFLISVLFVALYAKNKSYQNYYLLIGCISFGLALLTNPLVGLWLPFILSVVFYLRKERVLLLFLSIGMTVFLAILINSFLIAYAYHAPIQNGIHQYLFGEDIKIAPNVSSVILITRFIRNAFIPILQNSTTIVFILSVISFMKIFHINKKLFVVTLLWISPSILTNQWFDPLLFGRHGIIAGFGLAFLASILLEKRKLLFFLTIGYLLIVSLPALNLLRQPIPYIEMGKFTQTLPKGLLIETHFARPQVEGYYSGKIIFVNQPGWDKKKLEEEIDSYLNNKQPIFITSQALSDPYGIYSGPFLYPLSLSYAKKFELEDIGSQYLMRKYATIDKNAGLTIFKIVSKEKTKYPDIPKLNRNRHRIDYFDPITQLWFLIDKAKIIQSHNIIKG